MHSRIIKKSKVQLHRSFGTCHSQCRTTYSEIGEGTNNILGSFESFERYPVSFLRNMSISMSAHFCEIREGANCILGSLESQRFSCIVPSEHVTVNVGPFIVKLNKELIIFSDHLKVERSLASFLWNMPLSMSAIFVKFKEELIAFSDH